MSKDIDNKYQLNKTLSSLDILVVAFGAMIGWGWVISSGSWIQKAGVVGTIIGFIVAGVMIYFVGLVYAELTTAMPRNGGCLLFSYKAFGSGVSFICTWSMIFGYIGVVCFEACSLPTVIAYIFPSFLKGYLYTIVGFDVYASWLITAIAIALLITYINIRGIKTAALLQNILTAIIGIVGIMLIVSSAINGNVNNLEEHIFSNGNITSQFKNVFSIVAIAPFFLFGFDVIPQAAEEINVELKKIGRILVLSIVLAVSFYGLIVFSIGYAMNENEIFNVMSNTGLVAADAMGKMFKSRVMGKILILGGLCGIVTSWNSFLIGGSRAMFSMANSDMIPRVFCKLHKKYKTPVNALGMIGGLSILAPFFGKEMLNWIANSASFACCITYCIVSISYLKIRKQYPSMQRPFCVKKWKIVGIMAVIMSGWMILMYLYPKSGSSLNTEEWSIVLVWIFVGMAFYIFCKCKYKNKVKKIEDN